MYVPQIYYFRSRPLIGFSSIFSIFLIIYEAVPQSAPRGIVQDLSSGVPKEFREAFRGIFHVNFFETFSKVCHLSFSDPLLCPAFLR